jgi:glycosyltransferase involved in cell wall biosynthesis
MKPTLSIGIPTYNQGEYLEQTILSVLNQTIQPFEFVICNNYSTDGKTDEVLNKYKKQIRVIKPPKFLSMMENWNYLCSQLKGEYIALLSSDDFYEPDFVATFFEILKPDGVLFRFGFKLVNDNGTVIASKKINSAKIRQSFPGNFFEQIMGPKTNFASFVIQAKAFKKVNFFDENLKLIGDWGLWLKLTPLGCFYYSEKIVSNYRTNYRPTIERDRFELNISDFIHIYGNIQHEIIKQYGLNKNIQNNSMKLHVYKMEEIKKTFSLPNSVMLDEFKKMIEGSPIDSHLEYLFRSYLQNFREYFIKR